MLSVKYHSIPHKQQISMQIDMDLSETIIGFSMPLQTDLNLYPADKMAEK